MVHFFDFKKLPIFIYKMIECALYNADKSTKVDSAIFNRAFAYSEDESLLNTITILI